MRAQNAVSLCIRKDFDKPICREIRLGATIAHETEFANLVGTAFGLELFFGLADIRHFGGGVDHAWNDRVIDVTMFARDDFGGGHAFVFGFVRQHRTFDCVTNRIDARDIGLPMRVGFDLTAWGHFNA